MMASLAEGVWERKVENKLKVFKENKLEATHKLTNNILSAKFGIETMISMVYCTVSVI